MKIYILLAMFLLAGRLYAQHNHSAHSHDNTEHAHKEEPPHGGEIKEVDKYHVEILYDVMAGEEKLNIWILKASFQIIIPKDITGKVKIKFTDGKEIESPLLMNEDKLFCNIEDATKSFNAIITLTIKKKEYITFYNYSGLK
jgi:hypothetical protein